jgi:hypothetical protein
MEHIEEVRQEKHAKKKKKKWQLKDTAVINFPAGTLGSALECGVLHLILV